MDDEDNETLENENYGSPRKLENRFSLQSKHLQKKREMNALMDKERREDNGGRVNSKGMN